MACASCGKKKKLLIQQPAQMVSSAGTPDAVRLEYTGLNGGSINWRCPSGHTYPGSRSNRFADVFPEDVAFLENTRHWKRVTRIVERRPEPVPQVAAKPIEPIEETPIEAPATVKAKKTSKKATAL